jgi:hypothetical protein
MSAALGDVFVFTSDSAFDAYPQKQHAELNLCFEFLEKIHSSFLSSRAEFLDLVFCPFRMFLLVSDGTTEDFERRESYVLCDRFFAPAFGADSIHSPEAWHVFRCPCVQKQ